MTRRSAAAPAWAMDVREHKDRAFIAPDGQAWALMGSKPLLDWFAANDLDPTHLVRVELVDEDGPALRVTCYALDADGRLFVDPATADTDHPTAALRDPVTVPQRVPLPGYIAEALR